MAVTPKKAVFIGIAAVVVLIVGLVVFNLLTTEQVSIKASSANAEIFVDTIDIQQDSKGRGSVSLRLNPGNYNVRVVEGHSETRTTFKLEKGKPVSLELALEQAKSIAVEAPFNAINLKATNETVQFLWPGYGSMVKLVTESDQLQELTSGEYRSIVWVDTQKAYLIDGTDVYSYFDGATAHPLPYAVQADSLAVGPTEKVAYIDSNKVIVRSSAFTGVEYEIELSAIQPTLVVGPNNLLLVFDSVQSAEGEDQQAAHQVYSGAAKLEAATAALSNMVISGAAWSPSGDKLAVSAADGLYVIDVQSGSVTTLYKNYLTHPETITWVSDDELLFFLDQTIWKVTAAEAPIWSKLASVENSLNPGDKFAISPDGKKLYYATATSQLEGTIYSLQLKD